ncbi:MAG: hypothetical protein JXR23_01380, partial [Pontiellaceae bacterium]|nr:hypothetical protein [Pontiellaceae bacterium]
GNTDQIQAYVTDEKMAVEDRLQVYTWLSRRFSGRLPMLRQLEFNQAMIKLYDGVDNVRFPLQMYRILLQQVISLEAGEERDAWVDRLLGLWKDKKVEGAPSDGYTLSILLEVAATAGRLDEVRVYMENQNIQIEPRVYVFALRQGWYDWVAERLPNNIHYYETDLSYPDMWIPTGAVEHFEAMLESIKSDETRAVVRLFLSALPVKGDDGNAAVDKARIEEAFALADEVLEDYLLIRWVVGQYGYLRPACNLPKFKQSILKRGDMYLIQQIFGNGTFSEGDFGLLVSAVAEMDSPDMRRWFFDQYSISMFNGMIQQRLGQDAMTRTSDPFLETQKECIKLIAATESDIPVAFSARWLGQVHPDNNEKLATWLDGFEDDSQNVEWIRCLLKPSGGNEERIKAYLFDSKIDAVERAVVLGWLQSKFAESFAPFQDPGFNLRILDFYEGSSSLRIPQQTLLNMAALVEKIEDENERNASAERIDDEALKELEELKARLERVNDATRINNEPQVQGIVRQMPIPAF